jgi:hypothetical protein
MAGDLTLLWRFTRSPSFSWRDSQVLLACWSISQFLVASRAVPETRWLAWEAIDTGTERLNQAALENVTLSLGDTWPRRARRRDSRHPARPGLRHP